MFHGDTLSRVITRTSSAYAGDYTKLRYGPIGAIQRAMAGGAEIDLDRLEADMAAYAAKHSARKLSLLATGGKNADFYRNYVKGQDKRLSAAIFVGLAAAMGKSPEAYIIGYEPPEPELNAAVLASTFAVLLDGLGIDPDEDARAKKLAMLFPGTLRRMRVLRENAVSGIEQPFAEGASVNGANPREA